MNTDAKLREMTVFIHTDLHIYNLTELHLKDAFSVVLRFTDFFVTSMRKKIFFILRY